MDMQQRNTLMVRRSKQRPGKFLRPARMRNGKEGRSGEGDKGTAEAGKRKKRLRGRLGLQGGRASLFQGSVFEEVRGDPLFRAAFPGLVFLSAHNHGNILVQDSQIPVHEHGVKAFIKNL